MSKNRTFFEFIGKNGTVHADGCVSIAFVRPSTDALATNEVYIEGFQLEAGKSLTIAQNVGDVDVSDYHVVFESGADANELYVIKIVPTNGK